MSELSKIFAGVCGWWIAKAVQLYLGKSQLCFSLHTFHSTRFFFLFFSKIWMWTSVEHMRDNTLWNHFHFSPVSRSSACSGHCRCRIWLSAHHFWNLQFPHLQVSLISSHWHFLSALLLAQTAEVLRWFFSIFIARKDRRKRERGVWNRINGSCSYRCQYGIYMIVATATAQQVTALKQRWTVFKLPSELIYWPQTP